MKVFLASAGPPDRASNIRMFERLADFSRRHLLVDEPAEADVVLFTECHLVGSDWRLREIRSSNLARRYWDKCYLYDERDRPWCALPGLFVSVPASSHHPEWQVATSYTLAEEPWRKVGDEGLRQMETDLLFSFVGSRTHRCRDAVFALAGHPSCVVEPVTDGFRFFDPSSTDFEAHQRRFAEVIYRSKFVLCPRGTGTSSIRSYEVMAAGRVPVIISDGWIPPSGPDWTAFAVIWPESQIDRLPLHLKQREADAAEMGRRARDVYLERYSPEVWFDLRMDELESLHVSRAGRSFARSGVHDRAKFDAGAFALVGRARSLASRRVRQALDLLPDRRG